MCQPKDEPMTRRTPVRLLLAAVLPLLAIAHTAEAQRLDRAPVHVQLSPVMEDDMGGVAWNSMTEEFRRIWSREGVEIQWSHTPLPGVVPDVTLPIAFDDRELRKHDPAHEDAFGVTLFNGRTQRILVSIKRARQVVAARRGLADSGDSMTLEIALGRLLGRVVAHEIGHVLLMTTRHATHGLMNPKLETRDVGPLGEGQFVLSVPERERLAVRFSNTEAAVAQRADAAPTGPPAVVRTTTAGDAAVTPITWTDAPPAPSRRPARR